MHSHRYRTRTAWRLIVLLGVIVLASVAVLARQDSVQAKSDYLAAFISKYPHVAGTSLSQCTVCHTNNIPSLNPYGLDFAISSHNFAAIESKDSDGDGFSNLTEIMALSLPGDANSTPPTPTPTPIPPTPTATDEPGTPTATATPDTPTVTATPDETPTTEPTPGQKVEFEGFIESIDGEQWTIAGRVLRVDDQTEIDEEHGPAVIGAYVEVEAVQEQNGQLYALEIDVKDEQETPEPTETPEGTETPEPTETPEGTETPEATETPEPTETPEGTVTPTSTPAPGSEVEFKGVIEAQNADVWTIAGRTVIIDANTVIDESHGPALVGALVEVKARQKADGFHALRIETEDDGDNAHEIEFMGVVESMVGDTWIVAGRTILVTMNTQLQELNGPIALGALVDVKARQIGSQGLWAERIRTRHLDDDDVAEFEWEGLIEAMNGQAWTIGGEEVIVDGATEIDVTHGPAVVGAPASVHALQGDNGQLHATRVRILDRESDDDMVDVHGRVESISAEAWRVAGRDIGVDAQTVFNHISKAAPGALASVIAQRTTAQQLRAVSITVDAGPTDIEALLLPMILN